MGKKFSVSYEERGGAIEKYLRHEDSLKHLAKQLKVSYGAIKQWLTTDFPYYNSTNLDNSSLNL